MRRTFGLAAAALLLAHGALAQTPKVANAALEQRSVTGDAGQFVGALLAAQQKPAWVGYAVPGVPGRQSDWSGEGQYSDGNGAIGCGAYYLEGRSSASIVEGSQAPDRREGDTTLFILLRAERGQATRIRVLTSTCDLDAGGLPFIWLTGIKPADSVRFLRSIVLRPPATNANPTSMGAPGNVASPASSPVRGAASLMRSAVTAIALHDDPSADTALVEFVAPQQPVELRTHAAFWLGAARGERGYATLASIAEQDASPEFRRQATFALSQSQAAGAIDMLIRMARNDKDASVRSQAISWLAQKAGKKAVGTITTAIENDPDAQVKERAVFALSRLPKDEGVPLLIDQARNNRDPRVRQRAMFWLGESKDDRAVAFFEEVLKHK